MDEAPTRLGDGGPVDKLLEELFPFHIMLELGDEPTIVAVGRTLQRWVDYEFVGSKFDDHFSVVRPAILGLDEATLRSKKDAVFVFKLTGHFGELRGQIVLAGENRAIFIGSPVLTTTTRVEELGLSLADFAPHDATVDLIVLQRFAEMQLADLKDQAAELSRAREARDRLGESAATDPLTGVANRRAFWARCKSEMDAQRKLGLLFIDVDRFKAVNDMHGHSVGDAVLRRIAECLSDCVRREDLVARLGGDEFAVLLVDTEERATASIVERIQASVAKPFEVDGHICQSSISIGIVHRTANETVDDLIQDADAAMYEGRLNGPGRVTFFADRMRAERDERRTLTEDLEKAIEAGQIDTAFQPIVDLETRAVVTCEALARWNHPMRGPVNPAYFVELAERAALIERLDAVMLSRSLSGLVEWQRVSPEVGVQVNVSGRSVGPNLAARIEEALMASGVRPESLTVEVTESWLMQNETEVAAALREVAGLGVRIHLDDFGTGYSSLSHVHRLPISGLKIDRSFVGQAVGSERSRRLIAATIGMAHSLELEVVAEGVEDEETASLLMDLGCDFAQGFLFAKPGPSENITQMLMAEHQALHRSN